MTTRKLTHAAATKERVPATKRRTKQEQREDSTERLLKAAEECFISKGYRATRTEEIGAKAGLTKGAVYFYFGEKSALLLLLLDRVQARVVTPLAERLKNAEGSPLERIRGFLLQQAKLAGEEPAMLLLPIIVTTEFAGSGELPERRVRSGYQRMTELLAQVIAEGQGSGVFRKDISATQQASLILALNDGAMLEWWRSEPRVVGRGLVDALYKVLMTGIKTLTEDGAGSGRAVSRSAPSSTRNKAGPKGRQET